mgnify:CR=1 FL=1
MECKHGVNVFGVASCYNCVIEENQRLEAILGAADRMREAAGQVGSKESQEVWSKLWQSMDAYDKARKA